MGKSQTREQILLNILNSSGHITTVEAAKSLGISEATTRRMFSDLERDGKLVRNYGGAMAASRGIPYNFETRETEQKEEKLRIGHLAADLVESEDTIYLDCGTTTLQMAIALGKKISDGCFSSLNIVTNSISHLQALNPHVNSRCNVVLVGGLYNSMRRDFSGPLTEQYVNPFHFTKCFLGCEALNGNGGFYADQFDISSLNTKVMNQSNKSFILVDSTKFDKYGLIAFAPIHAVSGVVSDSAPSGTLAEKLAQENVEMFVADS